MYVLCKSKALERSTVMEAPDEKAAFGAMLRAAAAAAALLPLLALRPRTWSPRRMVNILWCCDGGVGMSEDRARDAREDEGARG